MIGRVTMLDHLIMICHLTKIGRLTMIDHLLMICHLTMIGRLTMIYHLIMICSFNCDLSFNHGLSCNQDPSVAPDVWR